MSVSDGYAEKPRFFSQVRVAGYEASGVRSPEKRPLLLAWGVR